VIIIEKNVGTKIAYEAVGTKLFLGDDELMLNLTKYQRDWPVHIDICTNRDGMLVVGTGDGLYYTAQVEIPPVEYTEAAEDGQTPTPILLDMDTVTLTLWSIDTPTPSPVGE
jgi:hypothetical protein